LRGNLDVNTPLKIVASANVVNVLLDLVLVVGLHMSSTGAAIATTTSEVLASLAFLSTLRDTRSITPTILSKDFTNNFDFDKYSKLVTASGSTLARTVILQAVLAGATFATGRMADTAGLAAHQIAIQIWLLTSFISDSIASAASGLIGREFGRGDEDAIKVSERSE